jgi:uracil-DNA glycosylase
MQRRGRDAQALPVRLEPPGGRRRRWRGWLLRRFLRLRQVIDPVRPTGPGNFQMMDAAERTAALARLVSEVESCTRCPLHATRTRAVPGAGDPDANLMFVGEAPGYHEDRQGVPFVGQAGQLLDRLLAGIGLTRADVYVTNVLKSRPPGNRDPQPDEIAACEAYLFRQLELVRPRVICTLGNFATKLLSGQPYGITRVHGRPQQRRFGTLDTLLYPIYHPAAALYTPAMLTTLEDDFRRLPELLSGMPAAPAPPPVPEPVVVMASPAVAERVPEHAQLGLF